MDMPLCTDTVADPELAYLVSTSRSMKSPISRNWDAAVGPPVELCLPNLPSAVAVSVPENAQLVCPDPGKPVTSMLNAIRGDPVIAAIKAAVVESPNLCRMRFPIPSLKAVKDFAQRG